MKNEFRLVEISHPNKKLQTVKLHQAAVKALGDPIVRQRLAELGAEVVGNTPAEFAAFIAAESTKYAGIAKLSGVRVEE